MRALTSKTSLHELLGEHPFLVDFLAGQNPRLEPLRNRALLDTLGRGATLEGVAALGGVEMEELLGTIRAEVERRSAGAGAQRPGAAARTRRRGTDQLKALIQELHGGLDPQEARARFDALIREAAPGEIGAMEEELIREGMPVQEIQRLCDVHVAVMRSGLEGQREPKPPPGHPAHTYMAENEVITELANRLGALSSRVQETAAGGDGAARSGGGDLPAGPDPAVVDELAAVLDELAGIHNHYLRKENQLFPYLERHGITGPPKVMWGVHGEIRTQLKEARRALEAGEAPALARAGAALARSVTEMVFKENRILLPMAAQTLSREEWAQVRAGEDELGYAFVQPAAPFPGGEPRAPRSPGLPLPIVSAAPAPASAAPAPAAPAPAPGDSAGSPPAPAPAAPAPASGPALLELGTGTLTLEQVDQLLRHLPVDLSFVDAEGFVRYYSETPHRIFPRTPGAISRHVENCHPPKSVHMVREILRAFEAGERDVAEFWITLRGKFLHIRYFAVRGADGRYLGCLEMGQDVTPIRALEGERRLLEWS